MRKGPTTHVVEQGEWLSSIAASYGFGDPQKIWEHANNAGLRQARSDSRLLSAGDQLFIPAPVPAEVACATGKRHQLRANVPAMELKLELLDGSRAPLADQQYRLLFGAETSGERSLEGVTSGSGAISAQLPSTCRSARLVLPALGVEAQLAVGALDPMDDEKTWIAGAQARLNNLGFACGAIDGVHGAQTSEALCVFQQRIMERKSADGTLDEATRKRLIDEHGS